MLPATSTQHEFRNEIASSACSFVSKATIAMHRLIPFLSRIMAHLEILPKRQHNLESPFSSIPAGKFLMQTFLILLRVGLKNMDFFLTIVFVSSAKMRTSNGLLISCFCLLLMTLCAIDKIARGTRSLLLFEHNC